MLHSSSVTNMEDISQKAASFNRPTGKWQAAVLRIWNKLWMERRHLSRKSLGIGKKNMRNKEVGLTGELRTRAPGFVERRVFHLAVLLKMG